jgi:hypothetical protein
MSKRQIPRGPEDLYCPMWRKAMVKVCHTCPWWQMVRGKNPNTGEEIDDWRCAVGLMPLGLLEVAHKTNQMGAAIESARNEAVKAHQQDMQLQVALIHEVRGNTQQHLIIDDASQLALPMRADT